MDTKFANWMTARINEKGWSLRYVARKVGLSHTTVTNVANGRTSPSVELCLGLARVFDLPAEDVFRLAEMLPSKPQVRHVNSRRPTYEVDGQAEIVQLWQELEPEDRALVRELMVRLAGRVEPRIFGEEG